VGRCFAAAGITAAVWVVVFRANRLTCMAAAMIDDCKALIMGVSNRSAGEYERAAVCDEVEMVVR
jgi:hypothetical protein